MKKINAIVFLTLIFGFFIANFIIADAEVSFSEKRNFQQFEAPTVETLMNGEWFETFTDYSSDQFPLRESFRGINAVVRTQVLKQLDVGGLYSDGEYIFKSDYPMNSNNIQYFAQKTNEVYEEYIKGKADNYYVSVVPDKSYFDNMTTLNTDAKIIADEYINALTDAEYIDIFGSLELDSYYKTDTHWSQDKLFPAMEVFANGMGFDAPLKENYTENIIEGFYGVYHGQSALGFNSEEIIYMTNDIIDASMLYNVEINSHESVYKLENFNSSDPYNIFSSGASSLVEIESPLAKTDKELIIFRDSFGSAIAPLFLEEYSKVTLVDLRYMSISLLDQYIDFENADVLVLYSSLILNTAVNFR